VVSFKNMSLEDAVDKLLSLKDKAVCAQIDAGACRTETDYKRKRHAEEELEEAREVFAQAFDVTVLGK
jgi:hypothetical protein